MIEKTELAYVMQIYSAKNSGYPSNQTVYAELASVTNGKRSPFKPLSQSAFRSIFALANEGERLKYSNGLLDPGIISFSDRIEDNHVLWYREAKVYDISTTSRDYKVFLPAMLYHARETESFHLYALNSNKRPNGSTRLYFPPVKNLTGDSTKFCWGNVNPTIKSTLVNNIVKEWEGHVWDSKFNDDGPEMIKKGRIYDLYKQLHKTKARFPKGQLKDTRLTINDILK